MSAEPGPEPFEVASGDVTLAGEAGGEGPAIALFALIKDVESPRVFFQAAAPRAQ